MIRFLLPARTLCRLFALWLACLAVGLMAGCGKAEPTVQVQAEQPMTLADLPSGLGRGFPMAGVEGDVQPSGLVHAGTMAPDFSLVLEDGRFVRLSDFKGRLVVINFWATWCAPCRLEMPELVKAAQDEELVVLAVDVQEARPPVEKFAAEFGMDFPVILDVEGKLRNLYGVPGLPTTFFIGEDGTVVSLMLGQLTPQALAERLAELR